MINKNHNNKGFRNKSKGSHKTVPVGHIWKFDLEQGKRHDFEVKWKFSKSRIEHVMLKFLATTEKSENKSRRIELLERESSQK